MQDDKYKAMGTGWDNEYETVTDFDDLHQVGYRAGEETKGNGGDIHQATKTKTKTKGGRDHHDKTMIKTEKGQDDVFEAVGVGQDNGYETKTNYGNSHQDAKTKMKTEGGNNLQAETRTRGKGWGRR